MEKRNGGSQTQRMFSKVWSLWLIAALLIVPPPAIANDSEIDILDEDYYEKVEERELETPLERILGVAERIERKFDSVDQKADKALGHAAELPDLIAIVKKHEFALEYVKETQRDLRGEVRSNTETTSRNTKLINDVALNLALVAQTVGEWKSGKDKYDGVKSGIFITVLSGVIIIIFTWLFNLKEKMLKLLFIYKRLLRISRGKSNQEKKMREK